MPYNFWDYFTPSTAVGPQFFHLSVRLLAFSYCLRNRPNQAAGPQIELIIDLSERPTRVLGT